jgi:uncharacterized protein
VEVLTIPGPLGRLDARRHGDASDPPVILLHPHPQFGGTMGSRLVHDLAVGLSSQGWQAFRFDYRGVGRSEGLYGQGIGETEDATAVFDAVSQRTAQVPAVVGYSFGGGVACRLATMRKPSRLVLVATPLRITESLLRPLEDAPRAQGPAFVVAGDEDGFVKPEESRQLAQAFQPPADLEILAGAAHFLEPSQNPRAVASVVRALGEGHSSR